MEDVFMGYVYYLISINALAVGVFVIGIGYVLGKKSE